VTPRKVPEEFEGWMSASAPSVVEAVQPTPWPTQEDIDKQRKFSERISK
jgi:hypothetical protein